MQLFQLKIQFEASSLRDDLSPMQLNSVFGGMEMNGFRKFDIPWRATDMSDLYTYNVKLN